MITRCGHAAQKEGDVIKHFCDVCGMVIERNFVSDRLVRRKGRVSVEVMVTIDNVANKGDICLPCLLDVLNSGVIGHKYPEKQWNITLEPVPAGREP